MSAPIVFTIKTRKSAGDGVSQRQILGCSSVEVEWALDNQISVYLKGLSGTGTNLVLLLDHPTRDPANTFAEIIIENLQGKTTERFVADRIVRGEPGERFQINEG